MAKNESKSFTASELAIISESTNRTIAALDEKVKSINWLMGGVIIIMFIGFATMFFMVFTIYIDASHFNSAIYQEYSDKLQNHQDLTDSNRELTQAVQRLTDSQQKK